MLFDVKSTALNVPYQQAFAYIADVNNLPLWAKAFAKINADGSAIMQTEQGQVPIKLEVTADINRGTVDWKMTFPDDSQATAYSRVVALSKQCSAYSFLLTPPPVPLEMLEGALVQQAKTLEQELITLKNILEVA
jgi:hypothetical protein